MQETKFEKQLRESAEVALEKVIKPFLAGSLPSKKLDPKKLSMGAQMVTNYRGFLASKMHNKGLNLDAIKLMTGEDKEAARQMIAKHFDAALALPTPSK